MISFSVYVYGKTNREHVIISLLFINNSGFFVFPFLGLVPPAIRPHVRLQCKIHPYILNFIPFPHILC